jgi:hypothetical protein
MRVDSRLKKGAAKKCRSDSVRCSNRLCTALGRYSPKQRWVRKVLPAAGTSATAADAFTTAVSLTFRLPGRAAEDALVWIEYSVAFQSIS